MEQWHFVEQPPNAKVRNPIQGEFFATEAIDGPAEALIREGVQNAIDARDPSRQEAEPVLVRIFLSGPGAALPPDRLKRYTVGLWPHIAAEGNGLKSPPQEAEPCQFLVFEDFGTTGLTGDVQQRHPIPGRKNSFFYFFRAEGLTDKGDGKGGSWGVGKYVFPRSSMANVVFGLTVRSDDQRQLLMGSVTLKTRRLDGTADTWFTPDGWFGMRSRPEAQVMPVEHTDLLGEFSRDFRLNRNGHPGLSLVVPWVDPEITFQSLAAAVVRGWFFPIMARRLVVTLETPDRSLRLDAGSLEHEMSACDEQTQREVRPLIVLARAYLQASQNPPSVPTLNPPDPEHAPRWSDAMLSLELRTSLSSQLDSGQPVVVRVPLAVTHANRSRSPSRLDLVVQRDEEMKAGNTTFLRNSIIIPEVKGRARGVRALVIADHAPVANFLRDAEHPAHTHWSKETSNFKAKYQWGPSTLSFIHNSVPSLMGLLAANVPDQNPRLLIDYFYLPRPREDDEDAQAVRRRKKKDTTLTETPVTIEGGKPRTVTVSKVAGGFTVARGSPEAEPPQLLRIRVAYDCRRGNPFKQWDRADFHFGDRTSLKIESIEGVQIRKCIENRMLVAVTNPEFRLTVTGFDPNRDIVVRVDPEKNDDQAD